MHTMVTISLVLVRCLFAAYFMLRSGLSGASHQQEYTQAEGHMER